MITNAIIYALYQIVHFVAFPVLALDNVVFPDGFYTAISSIAGYLSALNKFLPIDTILIILEISIAIEVAYLTYKLIMWVIKRFPTQS